MMKKTKSLKHFQPLVQRYQKASNAEFKQMKKQLKNVIKIQKLRLETAMLADRCWTVDAWESFLKTNE